MALSLLTENVMPLCHQTDMWLLKSGVDAVETRRSSCDEGRAGLEAAADYWMPNASV